MTMLRQISGHTRKYEIRNKEIYLRIKVVPIDEKMKEHRLRWFDHVQRRAINALVRKSELIQIKRTKNKVDEDKKNMEVVENDELVKKVIESRKNNVLPTYGLARLHFAYPWFGN